MEQKYGLRLAKETEPRVEALPMVSSVKELKPTATTHSIK